MTKEKVAYRVNVLIQLGPCKRSNTINNHWAKSQRLLTAEDLLFAHIEHGVVNGHWKCKISVNIFNLLFCKTYLINSTQPKMTMNKVGVAETILER